ncbi:nascent polypeptide-associated complex protein [Candidatus Woesearchaeota archaeon]|nr:nascent polypeptide-associated complex protein [Candidatus Woesearchaeota archaeon]
MIPGMNPKQMQKMMKQMGVQQEDLPVNRVDFYFDDHKIIIEPASVAIVKMMGQESFQVTGDLRKESLETSVEISDEDIQTVVDQVNCSKEDARKAIEDADGDLAAAIMSFE